jgi:Ser/Thr protein kinase RdoA (MazF antagonist)
MRIPPGRRSRVSIWPRGISPHRPANPARWSPVSPSSPCAIRSRPWLVILPCAHRWLATLPFASAPRRRSTSSRPFTPSSRRCFPRSAPLWTHNDLHASNLFWSDETPDARATAIIDFGLADRTNAVHDLAHAIERNIIEWLTLVDDPAHPDDVPIHLDHLDALLDGYESIRPLPVGEAAALAPMTALCHAEFALSEADYFLGVLRDEEKAVAAYDGWLIGHAQWFLSDTGRELLDALRHRARSRNSRGATLQ